MGKRTSEKKVKKFERHFSAGGAVFKTYKDTQKWLLVKPTGFDRWQLPKGIIEKGEKVSDAALREVCEEGGVKTKIIKKVGSSSYFYVLNDVKIFKTVTYFLMEVIKKTKEGHDQEIDKVIFKNFDEALKLLTFKDDKRIIAKAKEILESPTQESLV